MDRATLVAFDLELGDRVISTLDHAGLRPAVALWAVLEEYGDARLVLASRKFDQKSLRKADADVLQALRRNQVEFPGLPPVLIYRMTDRFIQALRDDFAKAKSVQGMRLGNQLFGGSYLEEAYVYRIE